ncbi:thioesterase [Streptomyces sp. WAC05374]|uniref:thioesterase II family protein n=1 Tax=Streptomyces sp. WAC05374 TaxID=2487420 RepID=UPI000F87A69C|nr:alpha/beta fold hydrolase [Streptomyces sp. WAC05374]RST15018.1 thioesterase [Streptomyces sp. WAC05374]TDF54725.1 thioesterase [Streptomyces sp. WAC05374]TDF56361.1 thioesterase [Streptomyces sp. WAC05374]
MSESHADDGAWIRRFHPSPDAGVRLVCFPHAGGSASFFHALSRDLAPGVDVLAVQYPGRQDRRGEPNVTDMTELADRAAEALLPVLAASGDPHGRTPFALFGHSMGSTLAYEVARRLQASGHRPAALIVSGRRAPQRVVDDGLHELSDDDIVADIMALDGTDTPVFGDPEVLGLVLPSIRADYRAAETYRYTPGPPLDCPIHAMTGFADPRVPVGELRHWAACTEGRFTLEVFSGGHFYLTEHHADVARTLAERLLPAPVAV